MGATKDIRSPLAKERDKWIEQNQNKIRTWSAEANVGTHYIENRLVTAFLDGAKAQEKINAGETA